jgi:hypothetical protein
MSDRQANTADLNRDPAELRIGTYNGFVLVACEEDSGEWIAVKIVIDAAVGIEWPLPGLSFGTAEEAFDRMRAIADAAYPGGAADAISHSEGGEVQP